MPKKSLKNITKAAKEKGGTPPFTVSLVLCSNCNLKCTYCYEKHDLRNKRVMDITVAKDTIRRCMEAENQFESVIVEMFGGEPFLAFPLMKEIVLWAKKQNWERDLHFMIGTNGTILTDEIKDWLLENKKIISLGISIDGTKEAHDLCRDNSYDLVRKNLPFFMKHWPDQPAKMTISADTIPYVAEGIIELEEIGLFFTANIGFEDMWGEPKKKEKLLKEYENQLLRLVEYYAERLDLYPVSPLLDAVPGYLGLPDLGKSMSREYSVKRFCGAGHEMEVVDVDGSRYPCHRFLPWITKRMAPKDGANCQMAWKPENCAECKLILSCPTCAGFNWEINNNTGIRTTFHCESYKLEVLASSRLEAYRLARKLKEIPSLPLEEKREMKTRINALLELVENGV